MSLNLLQLSDIHLCSKNSPTAESVLLGNEFHKGAPDAILITGDIFDHSAFSDENTPEKTVQKIHDNINKAIDFINDLLNGINAYYNSHLNKNSVLFVPGNHEISRAGKDLSEHLANYRLFLATFYDGKIPTWYSEDLTFVKVYNDNKVVVVGFRSPHCSDNNLKKNKYDDYGLIDSKQLFGIRQILRTIKNRNDYTLIAALHHQFVLMEERDKTYVEKNYLRNSEEFIHFLSEENFSAVLHGHKHISSNKRLNIEIDITKQEKVITVLGCGSISDKDKINWFNYITVFPAGSKYEIEYSTYKRENAGYILEKEPIKLPIFNSKPETLIIKSAINDDPDLSKAYYELCSYDTVTPIETVFRLLDSTVFSLTNIVEQIKRLPDSIYFILAVAHYRYSHKSNDSQHIRDRINTFIQVKKRLYFSDSQCFDEINRVIKINELYKVYQKNIEGLDNNQKKLMVYSAMVTLITEFYLIIKYGSEEFYKTIISKKIDFAYSGSNLSNELRGNTVEFSVDDERRSLEISVTCDTAESIKICSLIIKEFEIILHDFERDFSDCGFRIYYVLPKLKHEGKRANEIDSRQFTSYIPKLLPLLAGRNIYSDPEAFAREVIQNSIDAINVRKEHDSRFTEEGIIKITIDFDKKIGLSYFEIEDNGSGMTKYILERYLTTLGLSYYNGSDYQALNPKYDPISQFGIGFLSCFMLGKHIEVKTKHYSSSIGYFLDIPNYDGCFFIEEDKSRKAVGTSIRIWENPEQKLSGYSFDSEKIILYIRKYIKNINIDIYLNDELSIPKTSLWNDIKNETAIFSMRHFMPIEKDLESGVWVFSNDIKTNFGITIFKPDETIYSMNSQLLLLNNGILIPSITECEKQLSVLGDDYFWVYANLPPETMNLDVSRDKLKNFNNNINWESISAAFKKEKVNYLNKKTTFYLLQQVYNAEKYSDSKIIFNFNANNCEIVISISEGEFKGNANSIKQFLNFISNGLFSSDTKFPLPLLICKKIYGESAILILSDIYEAVSSITDVNFEKHYSLDAQGKEYDSPILDVLFAANQPFFTNNINTANEISKFLVKHGNDSENLNSEIKALANCNKNYYNNVRKTIKSDITNMFKDNRYTAPETSKSYSADKIKKITKDQKNIAKQLEILFKGYLRRAYTGSAHNNKLSLVNVAAITCSAIYTLLDVASVVCSYEMLENGVKIPLNRIQIEPAQSWFASL